MSFVVDLILELFADAAVGGRARRQAVNWAAVLVGGVIGAGAGVLFYAHLLDQGWAGILAWLLIPFMATYIVLTLVRASDAVKGGLFAVAVAIAAAVPMALLDLLFSPWMG